MRKFTIFLMTAVLLICMVGNVWAAENGLVMEDLSVTPGQTIYLSVTLNQSLNADAIGVRYSYDAAVLEPLPDSALWEISGSLSDFSLEDSGVWANTQAKDVKGRLFTLAFRIKDGATLTETTVTCTVVFKNGDGTSTEMTATGRVTGVCNHNYGSWASAGQKDHNRKCTLCGKNQSQSHVWNEGTTDKHPSNPMTNVVTYTCTVCGATRSMEMVGEAAPPELPTIPAAPTLPVEPDPTLPPLETLPSYTVPEVTPTQPQHIFGKPEQSEENQSDSQSGTNNSIKPTKPADKADAPSSGTSGQDMKPTQPAPGHTATDFNNSSNQKPEGNNSQSGTNDSIDPTQSAQQTKPEDKTEEPKTEHSHELHTGDNPFAVAVPVVTMPVSAATEPTVVPYETHDHEHTIPTSEDPAQVYLTSGLALLAASAALAAAGGLSILLIRRIRKSK